MGDPPRDVERRPADAGEAPPQTSDLAPVASDQPPEAHDRIPEAATPPPSRPSRRALNPFVELVVILAVAFGLAYVAQGWLVKPYRIPSASMEPTLQSGDRVLVNRFIYRFHGPHRGDVIVFHPPGRGDQPIRGATTQASVYFIKRLVGLPGETIQVTTHSVLVCKAPHVGCSRLREPYLPAGSTNFPVGTWPVPPGGYFVMGDNRRDSDDSRDWGFVPRANIIGEAFVTYWPLDRLRTL